VGWQPHFSSSYTLVGPNPKLLDAVYSAGIGWTANKIAAWGGESLEPLRPAEPGETLEVSTPHIRVTTGLFVRSPDAPAGTDLPLGAWDLTVHHTDSETQGREWRIAVGAKTLPSEANEPNRVLLSISSSFRDTTEQILPTPSVPLLRHLTMSLRDNATVMSGRTPLTGRATIIDSPEKAYEFMAALGDETRRHPIVLVSAYWTDDGEARYLVNPSEVSRALNGLAQVYFEGRDPITVGETSGLAQILWKELGIPSEYLAWGGVVRVYRPGDALALAPNDHRYMHGRDFFDKTDFLEKLRNGVYLLAQHDFATDPAGPITPGKDIQHFNQTARLDGLRARSIPTDVLPDITKLQIERNEWALLAEDLDRTNQSLREQEVKSRTEVSELKYKIAGLEDLLAQAIAENARLHEARKTGTRAASPRNEAVVDPSTLTDGAAVLAAIGERFSGQLAFTTKFNRSLMDFEPNDPALFGKVYEAIVDLHELLWRDKFERGSTNFFRDFNAQSRFALTMTESKQTKEKPGLAQHRTDVFEGERFEAWPHLKYGTKPGEQFRLHFEIHEASKRIIVSWVGDHMPTSSSSKTGRRRG